MSGIESSIRIARRQHVVKWCRIDVVVGSRRRVSSVVCSRAGDIVDCAGGYVIEVTCGDARYVDGMLNSFGEKFRSGGWGPVLRRRGLLRLVRRRSVRPSW